MSNNLTLTIVSILSALLVYLIVTIRAKSQQIKEDQYKYNKMVIQLDSISNNNVYLIKQNSYLKGELHAILIEEAEVEKS